MGNTETNKVVVTVVGKDRKGIIASVATALAEHGANILEISQTILQEYFTMIMIVDTADSQESFAEFKDAMTAVGDEMGMVITCMHQDIFQYILSILLMQD